MSDQAPIAELRRIEKRFGSVEALSGVDLDLRSGEIHALLGEDGAAIVFITHHLADVLQWADRITVLRHGKLAGSPSPAETSAEELARLMVGRDVTLMRVAAGRRSLGRADGSDSEAKPVLDVRGLRVIGDRGVPALE